MHEMLNIIRSNFHYCFYKLDLLQQKEKINETEAIE